MNTKPNTERRANLLLLRAFVAKQADGSRVSWVEIEEETGVAMRSQLNRQLFRCACHREKRGYLSLPGGGVEFSSAVNAIEVVGRYNKRVMGAVKSACVKGGYVVARHVDQLQGDEAKALIRTASLASTLSMVGRQAKAIGNKT